MSGDREISVTRCRIHGRLEADDQVCPYCEDEGPVDPTTAARRRAQAANAIRGVGARVTIVGKE